MVDATSEYLTVRKGVWHFVRRVPVEYADLDRRGIVKLSTKIKYAADRGGSKAGRVAHKINETLEAYWRTLCAGKTTEARQAYADAVKLARSMDLDYVPPAEGAERPIADVLARIETLMDGERWKDPALGKAALGAIPVPVIMLSSLFEEYQTTQRLKLAKMSPDQVRKWTSAKKRAVEILIERIDDKPVHEVSRDNALSFVDWWEDRVISEGVQENTANKNISHIAGQIRAVSKRHGLRLEPVFAGLRLEGGKDGSRKPFELAWIRDVILADGALTDLNDEARDVVYILMETGARACEIVNLTPGRILLDASIPHIRIMPEGRILKSDPSERDIPLVGMALEAMRRHPQGFPRYFDAGSNLSATLMKHFEGRKLLPTQKHAIYSFRHSMKDRLKAVLTPEEMIDEIMGHKVKKPKYGDGYGLQLKRQYLQTIALTSPALAAA
jgi:integrase